MSCMPHHMQKLAGQQSWESYEQLVGGSSVQGMTPFGAAVYTSLMRRLSWQQPADSNAACLLVFSVSSVIRIWEALG